MPTTKTTDLLTMGTKLTIKKAGSEVNDLVLANLESIGEQATDTEEIDVTTLDSPNGAKEYLQGAKDAGSVDVVAKDCDDGQVAKLKSIFDSGATRTFVEEYRSGATLTYAAYISSFKFGEATTDGQRTITLTLRLSGEPEYAEANES